MSDIDDLRAAMLQTHQQLQRLYLLLADKGVISHDELAYVTGEGERPEGS